MKETLGMSITFVAIVLTFALSALAVGRGERDPGTGARSCPGFHLPLFPGGRGTADMVAACQAAGITVVKQGVDR